MTEKIKPLIAPIIVIVLALFVGGIVLLNQKLDRLSTDVTTANNNQNARLLSFKAPGMFCLGCSASIEGYLSAVEGVQSVNASLATKLVEVVYDPSIVDKDTILANEILDSYGKEFLSDDVYTGSDQAKTPSTTNLPQGLALKLQNAAGLISQLDNADDYKDAFDQIDQAIVQQDYQQAEDLLDGLLSQVADNNE